VSGERRGWSRGWDVRGAAIGLVLVAAGIVLARRDEVVRDALPGLLVAGVAACVALAVVLGPLEGQVGDALSRARTRRRVRRAGAEVVRR
jgi:hypothetical protein